AAAWLAERTSDESLSRDRQLENELKAIAAECSALSDALAAGRPPAAAVGVPPPATGPRAPFSSADEGSALPLGVLSGDVPGLRPVLGDMWQNLDRARGALGFLDPDRPAAPALDQPARTPLLTPAFSLANTSAIGLALKAALGVEICYLLMHAMDWSALLTAGVTVVLIS